MNDPASIPAGGVPARAAGALLLLDREPPPDYLGECTERIATENEAAVAGTKFTLVFRIGGEWLGLPPRIFQQVAEQCPMRSLPHRRDGIVRGIVNIRGELIVCVSLGAALGLERVKPAAGEAGSQRHNRLLVANHGGNRLAFPVDEIYGVLCFHPDDLRPPPATLSESKATYTIGLLPWRDRTIGCLDDESLFYTLNRSLA